MRPLLQTAVFPFLLTSPGLLGPGAARAQATKPAAGKAGSSQSDDNEVPGSRLKPEGKPKPEPKAKAEEPRDQSPRVERSTRPAAIDKSGAATEVAPAAGAPAEGGDDIALPPGMAGKGGPGLKMRYQGVAPGRAELPPHPPQLPLAGGPQRLTWPGFQIKDGVPTVFLQLSGPVEFTVEEQEKALVVTLQDTIVPLRNNLNPLRVDQFNTPVQAVRVQRKKVDKRPVAVVTVSVKGPVTHKEQIVQAENGYSMFVLSVVSGAAPTDAAPAPDAPADAAPATDAPPADAKPVAAPKPDAK